jgi:hypothetical protein
MTNYKGQVFQLCQTDGMFLQWLWRCKQLCSSLILAALAPDLVCMVWRREKFIAPAGNEPLIFSCSAHGLVIMHILLSWLHATYLNLRKDSSHCQFTHKANYNTQVKKFTKN